MPWSGSFQTFSAHAACAWTIGHRRRGSRSLWRVWSRIESSTAPYTSFCRWSNAPLPIRTGLAPAYPDRSSRVDLREVTTTVDPVHDLQRTVLGRLDVRDELHELVGFPVELQHVERLQGERGVADPRVAVVPVALPARRFGERRGERRDGRARGHVRESLDRQGRTLEHGRHGWSIARVRRASHARTRPCGDPGSASSSVRGVARSSAHDSAQYSALAGGRGRAAPGSALLRSRAPCRS